MQPQSFRQQKEYWFHFPVAWLETARNTHRCTYCPKNVSLQILLPEVHPDFFKSMSHRKHIASPYKEICRVIANTKREHLSAPPSQSDCPKPDLFHPETRLRPLDNIDVTVRDNKLFPRVGVTVDGVWFGYSIYWLLIHMTHKYKYLQRHRWSPHNSQITTAAIMPFPACCILTSRSLATAANSEVLQLHPLKSSLHSLLYRTDFQLTSSQAGGHFTLTS
jgi:hypothetical protein